MEKFYPGQIIKCSVTGVVKYGIFVRVNKNYTGLIHISEVSKYFVKNINDYAMVGDMLYCKVLEVDEDSKKLKLSIKGIDYKSRMEIVRKLESKNGFKPLKDNLINWIEEYKKHLNK